VAAPRVAQSRPATIQCQRIQIEGHASPERCHRLFLEHDALRVSPAHLDWDSHRKTAGFATFYLTEIWREGKTPALLAPMGLVISYGRLDGPPNPDFVMAMREHHAKSPAVRFFTIHSFDDRPDIRTAATQALLDHLAKSEIKPLVFARLPLAEARRAHEMLEAGEVIGKILLRP